MKKGGRYGIAVVLLKLNPKPKADGVLLDSTNKIDLVIDPPAWCGVRPSKLLASHEMLLLHDTRTIRIVGDFVGDSDPLFEGWFLGRDGAVQTLEDRVTTRVVARCSQFANGMEPIGMHHGAAFSSVANLGLLPGHEFAMARLRDGPRTR